MVDTISLKDLKFNKNNFVSQGGEGQIFKDKDIVYKIYHDSKKAMPFLKIEELAKITDENVVTPISVIIDGKRNIVGYSMKYLQNTYPMCQFFTKAFKDRNKIQLDTTLNLIKRSQETINNIHNNNILIVDLNELNLLLEENFQKVYFIDTDSYQTSSFPATAIMESIRDRHNKIFSEMTDWFSFGIITYQMFTNIHPFKGTHPKLKTLDERMLSNVPAFHPDVSVPKVCFPFISIPEEYREWYKSIFLKGNRVPPPTGAIIAIVDADVQTIISGNNKLEIIEIFDYKNKIIDFHSFNGNKICFLKNNEVYIKNETIKSVCSYFALSPQNKIILADIQSHSNIEKNRLSLFNTQNKTKLECDIYFENIMYLDGRLYIKQKDKISEITYIELPNKIIPVATIVTTVNENSTRFYDGVVLQDILGSCVACIFPKSKLSYQVKISEMTGYKIIDAKYSNRILIIIANKNGKYDKFIIKINDSFSEYTIRKVLDINYSGINFTVMNNGIVVHITEEEKIEIFSNDYEYNKITVIEDSIISGDMILNNDGNSILFTKGTKLYRMKVKK
jgi:serine/threonine protein kinase